VLPLDYGVTLMPMSEEFFDTLSDSKKPWLRQSCVDAGGVVRWESAKAHAAFNKYCELGDSRGVRAVATALGKSRTLIERWSRRWSWQERVKAYDDVLREAELAGAIRARRDMATRQSRTALLGQNIAIQALAAIQTRLQAKGNQRPLTPYEAVRLFEACSKIERICRGEPDGDGAVAAIHVHVELQKSPRWADAAKTADAKTEYDS
jgi:hypothetical protein